jgi:NADH-ubiquinone/plastoquinone oxidoreductase subunit 6
VPLDNVAFWVFAPVSVGSAIAMLTRRSAVHAALFLVVNFFCLAVMYLLLDAPFLFAVQIVVYAGAIMVLFLFVIMLLGVDRRRAVPGRPGWDRSFHEGSAWVRGTGQRRREHAGVGRGAVPGLLPAVRGDLDPADRGGDGGDGPGAAESQGRHPGGARGSR